MPTIPLDKTAEHDPPTAGFCSHKLEVLYERFGSHPDRGLDSGAIPELRKKFGYNRLEGERPVPWYDLVFKQFRDWLVAILVGAAALSFFIGDRDDTIAIVAILAINAILGFVQERKAQTTLAALKNMLRPTSNALRNGALTQLRSEELLPGDVVVLRGGDVVPADMRVIAGAGLKSDESVLTGEAEPIEKVPGILDSATEIHDQTNMLWMGSRVMEGTGRGLVVGTGVQSQFGKIARLTAGIPKTESPVQKELGKLARQLGIVSLFACSVIIVLGIIQGKGGFEMILTGISVAVAVIPEGLPTVVSISLALGARVLASRKALVKNLPTSETLGCTEIICTDKTGTLTKNEMTITGIWTLEQTYRVSGVGYAPFGEIQNPDGSRAVGPVLESLIFAGAICNSSELTNSGGQWSVAGSATEGSLLALARKSAIHVPEGFKITTERPFDATRKMMTVAGHWNGGTQFVYSKGAPEVLLSRCSKIACGTGATELGESARASVLTACREFAQRGQRTLALACKLASFDTVPTDLEDDLVFLGIVAIQDPPRDEVRDSIVETQKAGIKIIMITGDSLDTASAIAAQVGLQGKALVRGSEISSLSHDDIATLFEQGGIIARASPEHKLKIIDAFQRRGKVTAMTGDGVNDAPALKKADIGIAMGIRGTEVSKAAADMILLDDNFGSLVNAVIEGRRQFENIQKFVRYLLSSNLGEFVALAVGMIIGGPLILLPIQILWMNLVTDGATAITLSFEKAEGDLMARPPRQRGERILNSDATWMIGLVGTYIGIATAALFYFYRLTGREVEAQTVAFAAIIVFEKLNVFNFRSLRSSVLKQGFFSNPALLIAVAAILAIHISSPYVPFFQKFLNLVPLAAHDWITIFLAGLPILIVGELYKAQRRRSK